MERSRNILSIALVGLLIFANTVCACAIAADSVSDDNLHAHHQMQDDAAGADKSLCPHQECENCTSLDIAATVERDASSVSFAKLGFDDDVVWLETAMADIHLPLSLLARAGPPFEKSFRRAETPVRRADLLLE